MPSFSQRSQLALSTAHPVLQMVFNDVIQHWDCSVICGYRNEADQNAAYASKASEKQWPDGAHNSTPSLAVDAVPWIRDTVSFDPLECAAFAGVVLEAARRLGVRDIIRWGGDWDRDGDIKEHKLKDLVHFEVRI